MAEEACIILLKPPCENSTEETLYWGYLQGILENINILNVYERSVCITVFASFLFILPPATSAIFIWKKPVARQGKERLRSILFHCNCAPWITWILATYLPPIWNTRGISIRVSHTCIMTWFHVVLFYRIIIIWIIDLVTVFDAILTSGQTWEKLQCLYENLMSNNFHKTAFLKKISIVNKSYKAKDCT